jgi:hypothetical protein
VLQQLMANSDPTIQAALHEPANLGFIKSLVGLSELVVPGEDARNKQLREIQQLLQSPPLVVHAQPAATAAQGRDASAQPAAGSVASNAANSAQAAARRLSIRCHSERSEESLSTQAETMRDSSSRENASQNDNRQGGHAHGASFDANSDGDSNSRDRHNQAPPEPAIHVISTILVDQLLDDHATEFEECRRWASSDAGQVARVQNPAGFANVRAHAAQHSAALAAAQAQLQAQAAATPAETKPKS